ncbi:MAG: linoleoyl-CoA desaturase [Flavobacteriales bacterium]
MTPDFLVHQMHTTANFAPNNNLLSWYLVGLNVQIEHYLFPNMSHVHYKVVSKIIQATAKEFSVSYLLVFNC